MTAIPSSALLGQFASDITPAGQAVFGLKAQPFTDNQRVASSCMLRGIHTGPKSACFGFQWHASYR